MKIYHYNSMSSKDYILLALIELMKTEKYDSIRITDITEKAGVSRMAYYRNYCSKDDILIQYMNKVCLKISERLSSDAPNKNSLFSYYEALFEEFGKHLDFGRLIISSGLGELFLERMNEFFKEILKKKRVTKEKAFRIRFIAGAFYNVFAEWTKTGLRETPRQLAAVCCSMTNTDLL